MKMLHILLADCFGHSVQLSLIILFRYSKVISLQYLTSEWLKEINEYPTSSACTSFVILFTTLISLIYNLEQI